LRLQAGEAVARREGGEVRLPPAGDGWAANGGETVLGYPAAAQRCWSALHNPNAGELLVSAAPGWEFVDIGGRHHAGGGSHGSPLHGDPIRPRAAARGG